MISRRSLFGGAAALVAAPAIVRLASIMPVSMRAIELYGRSPLEDAMRELVLLRQAERLINPPVIIDRDKVLNAFTRMVMGRIPFVDMSAPPVEFSFRSALS